MFSKIGVRSFLLAMAAAFSELASSMEADSAEAGTKALKENAPKEKKTRKSKPAPAAVDEDMEEVESNFTESEEESGDDEDFAGMDEQEEEKPKAKTVDDLRSALVAHATAHGKPSAYEILAKFKGAKKAVDVKGADIEKAIKMLEAKKGKK